MCQDTAAKATAENCCRLPLIITSSQRCDRPLPHPIQNHFTHSAVPDHTCVCGSWLPTSSLTVPVPLSQRTSRHNNPLPFGTTAADTSTVSIASLWPRWERWMDSTAGGRRVRLLPIAGCRAAAESGLCRTWLVVQSDFADFEPFGHWVSGMPMAA